MSSLLRFLPIIVFVVSGVGAQNPVWGQCGGLNWTGQTTCVAGSVCTFQSSYYSQCLPGTATTPPVTTTTAVSSPPPSNAVTYWFPFGDSYTTTGFVPTMTLPTVGNPLGNPPFPGFTGGGGENFVGFDTVTYNKSNILTYNYAYGGATINSTLVAPYLPTVLSLIDQVNEFLAGAGKKPATSPWTSMNSLFTVWIGINDLGNSFSNSGDRSAFSDLLLNEYFAQVQELIVDNSAVGARNFLFINVPPMERTPLMIAGQNASGLALLKSVISTYNSKLAAKVASFMANNTGVKTWLWDAHTEFGTILDNPTHYGFVDAVSFGNTGDFWGNNYHPSSPAHQIFAQQISALMAGTPWF
ncbi:hypothetical protein B0H16DRAFT_1792884 [Mycena metata]|uniref:CBM1 domain-containing protein n=1 Tax=Mycena metata TaxID=1033252 RepID=A0AAD7NLB8_9AGAR|nr:hypothetical protein B0H16DRAFT_1792884 [Mycena metata]